MNGNNLKQQICDALATWIRQRPGLEFGNYGDISSYRSELRGISRDKRDAELLLATVRNRDSITAEHLMAAFKHAFSGRLTCEMQLHQIREHGKMPYEEMRPHLEYDTGQYWPREYRKAAAAVLASVLWSYTRTDESTGDTLRQHFRKEFGSALQRRWFN